MLSYSQSDSCSHHPEAGKLIKFPAQYFSLIFQETLCPAFREETLLSDLWITLMFYLMEAAGELVIVFIYFPKEIVTQCTLLRISHVHYRTTLGFISFFPLCSMQTGFPLLVKAAFDHTWEAQ